MFVNLERKCSDVIILYETFHGRRWPNFNSRKVCEINYGDIQGREQLKEHFMRNR